MRELRSFAYSLSQSEDGWRWNIIDEDGQTVARGAHVSRAAAQAAVQALLGGGGGRQGRPSTLAVARTS